MIAPTLPFNSYIRNDDEPSSPPITLFKKPPLPGFGEAAGTRTTPHWTEIALAITATIIPIITGIGGGVLGGAIGGVGGALIGASVGAALSIPTMAAIIAGFAIDKHCNYYRYKHTLEKDPITNLQKEPLGRYSTADVRVIDMPEKTFEWKLKLMASAETSIELSPNFAGGKYFQKALDVIETRMHEKNQLKTHIMMSDDLLQPEDHARLEKLKNTFPDRFHFLITPRIAHLLPTPHTEENHVKLLVVDGRYFTVGGSAMQERLAQEKTPSTDAKNKFDISNVSMSNSIRDVDAIAKSDVLGTQLRDQFFKLYQIWEMRSTNQKALSRFYQINMQNSGVCQDFEKEDGHIDRNVKTKALVGGPEHHGTGNPITREFIKRITKARKKINIANYTLDFVPGIQEALQERRNRKDGVKIVGYTNGLQLQPFFARLGVSFRSLKSYPLFNKVYQYNVPYQMYHKKTALFDRTHAIISSFNHGMKSGSYDHEIALVMKDTRIVEKCAKIQKEDKQRSTVWTEETIHNNSPWTNLVGHIFSFLSSPSI